MDLFVQVIAILFTWQNLLAMIGGVLWGLVIGILPGLGPAAGMALAIPLVSSWPPVTGLVFMGSLYKTSHYGGSITAILMNTPGDSSNTATLLDGYPMCEKGRGAEAMAISASGALVGGILGTLCLIYLAPWFAEFALKFGPAEYCLLGLLALTIVAGVVQGATFSGTLKGLTSAGLGLMFGTMGYDQIAAYPRYSFGIMALEDGIPVVPMIVGLFAVTEALLLAESEATISRIGKLTGRFWDGVAVYFKHPFAIIRSAIIGIIIGILPAVGQNGAGLVAWAEAKRESKHPETFGNGEPEGVICSETSACACMPGDLVLTIALGIPGSTGAAVFLGIMIILGLSPGPTIFIEKSNEIYTLFAALMATSFVMFFIGITIAPHFAVLTLLRNEIIVPLILVFGLIGSFAVQNSMFGVVVSLVFGLLGYVMKKGGFTLVPLLLGMVLGELVEVNYHRALLVSGGKYSIFFGSVVAKVLVLLIIASIVGPHLGPAWRALKGRRSEDEIA
jgi:putative tricarboxylic transport membrane protein